MESAQAAPLTGLLWGSIIFVVIGTATCVGANFIVGKKSPDRTSKFENRSLVSIVVIMSIFCMWLQWICTYMHQMNPITPPIPESVHE